MLARDLERTLTARGVPARAVAEKAYLKSELIHLGVAMPLIRAAVKAVDVPDRAALREAVTALWARGIHECRAAAIELLVQHQALLGTRDVPLVERLLRDSATWAYVDVLAARIMGGLVVADPRLAKVLDRWATDANFWIRRAAMLALLGPLRAGGGDFARFARYADAMLDEKEFFIRKAIGWILRDTARKRPALVYAWLAPRIARASGVTVREAVKYLPAKQRAELLRKR